MVRTGKSMYSFISKQFTIPASLKPLRTMLVLLLNNHIEIPSIWHLMV